MATTAVEVEKTHHRGRLSALPGQTELPAALRARLLAHVTTVADREMLEVTSPMNEERLGDIPSGAEEDVTEAVRRAREAQASWKRTSFRERARIMKRFHDLVLQRQAEVMDLIQLESGKVRSHAFAEVADVAIVANYYSWTAEKHLARQRRQGALPGLTLTEEVRHPKGVVGFIAPWNYPLSMAITDIIPALMAGNACVLKPAQQTPFTALWIVDLIYEAGLPAGLIQVVTGRGSTVGGAIIQQTDFITFTGSTAVGRDVAKQAGERLTGYALELGGKNPMIVCHDADIDEAVAGAIDACFASAGQLCISVERLFVHESVADEFTRKFTERVAGLELSTALAFGPEIGSLASRQQLETVERHVEGAKKAGATVLVGGERRTDVGPLFYAPTVLTDVETDMEVACDETFGPVVSLYRFRDEDEVIDRANDTPYGLNASIWTKDTRRGRAMARRIEAGTVNINDAYAAAWASVDAPMGGFKDSGVGRRHGREGILKYTEVQNIATQRLVRMTELPLLKSGQRAAVLTVAMKIMHRIPGLHRD